MNTKNIMFPVILLSYKCSLPVNLASTCFFIEMGNALMDVMNGTYNPAARLVVTWYADDSQFPPITNYTMVNRTYRYLKSKPMFYFGYGLSYTTFNYSNIMV